MDTGQAQMLVRLLGSHPKSQLPSKVFSMQMIEHAALPQEIRTDLQSSLDGLSMISKQLIMAAATEPARPIDFFVMQADLPHHQIQSCLSELTASGLIAPKSGGGFQFRDLMTAQAIHHLTVAISDLGES
jgi:hypothetical protein